MARTVADEDVLAAVIELSNRFHRPSTSLITWQLAGSVMVTSAFQTGVRSALQRLRAGGQLSCVMHGGTHRWGAPADGEGS